MNKNQVIILDDNENKIKIKISQDKATVSISDEPPAPQANLTSRTAATEKLSDVQLDYSVKATNYPHQEESA